MTGKSMHADVVIVGGSTGGCAAALACAKMGKQTILVEETDWIGGQLTSQAVPPDEHPWIEQLGCTASYRNFRDRIRDYYGRNFPLSGSSKASLHFNPGSAGVSRISHEPRAALAVLHEMLAPYVHSGKLRIMHMYKALSAETDGDEIRAVRIRYQDSGEEWILSASYFIDATDEGDLLALANVEYVTGSESAAQTGEPHALQGVADPMDMQAFTWCYALDYIEGEDHTIAKPAQYDFWREYKADFWPNKQLSWSGLTPNTLQPVQYSLFAEEQSFSLWTYRRVIDKTNFRRGTFDSDISIVNWPQNDYWLGPIIDVSPEERDKHLENARQLSLSLLYWMQTEAPRPDGKAGYPGLKLRGDVVGTSDGLAKRPYIRESRRIIAEHTVLEQHINPEFTAGSGPTYYPDSVGIGAYRIDLHPSTGLRTYIDVPSYPFQIPLGSLIPIRVDNVLPACKNIGTTHITNGCYRLHPVEWNIGEAAGYLAAFCLETGRKPREVRNRPEKLNDFQRLLSQAGIELRWPTFHAL